jgi:hypothetical protein
VSGLLLSAFRALGPGATRREIATVAKALRESGDEETLALFRPPGGDYFDHKACDAVIEIAEQAGAGPFVGLDLYVQTIRPGWSPFPVPRAAERAAMAGLEELGGRG